MEWWIILIACIGATSWIPQIIFILYKLFSKPKLQFISDSLIEVGYSSFGPILNPSFAVSTSRKDALLESIKLEVIHESEEKHEFIWKFLDERGPEIITSAGERTEMRKYQPATALKIGMLSLIEKKIGFQDISFQENWRLFYSLLNEKEEHIKKTEPQNYPDAVFKTKEFLDLKEFIKSGFYWKKGKYEVNLKAYEISLKETHIEHYNFELSKANAELLERNIKITQESEVDKILFRADKIKEYPPLFLNWVYPNIYKKKLNEIL